MATSQYTFEIYLDSAANWRWRRLTPPDATRWRWRLVAANGRRVAASPESFDSYESAVRSAQLVQRVAGTAILMSPRRLRRAA